MSILENIERAVLVAVDKENGVLNVEDSLEELKELAAASGAETVCMTWQKREKAHPTFYVGRGKVEEIKVLIDETSATVIIADDELSPAQIKNLGEALGVKVIDRTVVILDIFAARANSREGKIQVELAQQRYRLSRLSGIGVRLSRLGGGIGTRGPGEKKLETDRRHIREQIANLAKELKEIEKHRSVLRKSGERSGLKTVSMVGYTNAGKSTLLNALTEAGVLAEDKLFATLDITTRRLRLPGGSYVQLTDTVGFISKLPHSLIKAFRATLQELNYADILLHITDASNSQYQEQTQVVKEVLEELSCSGKPIITALNKIDKIDDIERRDLNSGNLSSDKVMISAKNKIGLEDLLIKIEEALKSQKKKAVFHIPYTEGGLISIVHGKSEIVWENHEETGVTICAYVDDEVYGRVAGYLQKTNDYNQ